MTTYVSNCNSALLFAFVKDARASGQSKGGKVEKGEWYWAYARVMLPRLPFGPLYYRLWEEKPTVLQLTYKVVLHKVKKEKNTL